MILIGDNAELGFLEHKERLTEILETKKYRVADSGLTYRQVHNLDKDGSLEKSQEAEGSWRKFSLMELVYLSVVKELRKFGLENDQLVWLREALVKDSKPITSTKAKPGYALDVVGLVLGKVEIILTVEPTGKVNFYDNVNFSIIGAHLAETRSFIYINLNEIVNDLLEKIGNQRVGYRTLLDIEIEISKERKGISSKEKELLDLIRTEEYKTIRVAKKDNETWIVRGERDSDGEGKTALDVLNAVNQKDFQDIEIQKRDGKVTHIKVTDVIRLQ